MLLALHSVLAAVLLEPFFFQLLLNSVDNGSFGWYKQEADVQAVLQLGHA